MSTPREGHLWKASKGWFGAVVWKRVRASLRGALLAYAAEGSAGKELDLRGAAAARAAAAAAGGREHALRVDLAAGGRTLLLAADSAAERDAWLAALLAAAAAGGASVAPGAQSAAARSPELSAAATPRAGADEGADPAAARAPPPLPEAVVVEGLLAAGSELRCRAQPLGARGGALLDDLCVAWFRLPAAPPQAAPGAAPPADAAQLPGFRLIAGAAAQAHTYLLTDEDVGLFVGCLCRPAVGGGARWAVGAEAVAPLDLRAPSARLALAPHEHNKYCDRRVRVCTAPGRYREGEVVRVQARGGAAGALAGHRAVWYRSAVLDASMLGAARAALQTPPADAALLLPPPPQAPALAAAAAGADATGTGSGADGAAGAGAAASSSPTAGSAAAAPPAPPAPPASPPAPPADWLDVSAVAFRPVDPRPVSDLAPAPPDYAPSPTVAEIRARLAPRLEAAAPPPAGFAAYPLFKEDVGRLLLCALVPRGAAAPALLRPRRRGRALVLEGAEAAEAAAAAAGGVGVVATPAVGPVEAAPPKAREIWIDGEARVGGELRGQCYYFGGFEGASLASWVAIREDGETVQLREPTPFDAGLAAAAALVAAAAPGAPAGAEDPRVLRLGPELRGCELKFRVQPVRSDGNAGHTESSRPTAEVAAAQAVGEPAAPTAAEAPPPLPPPATAPAAAVLPPADTPAAPAATTG